MIAFLAALLMAAATAGVRRAAKAVAGVAKAAVNGATEKVVRRGARKVRNIVLNLFVYWYVGANRKRHRPQERFLFGGLLKKGKRAWAKFRGLLGGRGLGKSMALMRKALLLALLNRGTKELPVFGAIFGRTLKEVDDKLLPVLMSVCAEIERDLGIAITPVHDKQRGILIFPFGSAVYLLSYESRQALEMARGYNLGWAVIDELEVAPVPIEQVLAVINFAIRDPRAKHKAFAWASTPKGYKGMPKLHDEARKRGDPNWYLVHGTIYDNPWLSADDVETIKSTIPSKRLWDQEGLAICVMASNTVFPEYSDALHLKKHRWNVRDKTVIVIDWGLSKAYIAACKVNRRGEWFVVKERKVVDTSRRRFRVTVVEFVNEVQALDGGRAPYAFACDRAVSSEKYWLAKKYGKVCAGRVFWLTEAVEMMVEWGCAIMSSLLEPDDDAPPKIYVSDALTPDTEFATMGIRGAFLRYTYETARDKDTGETITLDNPSKLNAADDPIDALRYGIVATRHMPELHGGKPLPFLDDATQVPTDLSKRAGALRRVFAGLWGAANDNDCEVAARAA